MRTRQLKSTLSIFALVFAAVGASGCGDHPVKFQGRLAFRDMQGCPAAVYNSQNVSWAQCNAFKRSFSSTTGMPVTTDYYDADSLRPLPGTVHLDVYRGGGGERGPLFARCGSGTFVTSANGIYNPASPRPSLSWLRPVSAPIESRWVPRSFRSD